MIDGTAGLLLVLAALVAVPFVLRRHRAATPAGLRVLGRTALNKHTVVAVVAVGDRRLLVGAGERGVALLAELDPAGDGHAAGAPDRDPGTSCTTGGRTDAVATSTSASPLDPADLLAGLPGLTVEHTTAGPGIGLVDRLRGMTVRTPVRGRPTHVLRR